MVCPQYRQLSTPQKGILFWHSLSNSGALKTCGSGKVERGKGLIHRDTINTHGTFVKVSRHVSQGPGGGTENWVPIGRRFFKCLGNVPQLHCADGYTAYTYIKVTDMDTKGHTSCSVNCRSRNLSTESDQSDPEATVPSLVWAPCQLTTLGPEGCWCWGQGLLGDWKRISQHRAWQRGETEQYLHHPGQLTWGLDSVTVPDLQPRGQILLWDTSLFTA